MTDASDSEIERKNPAVTAADQIDGSRPAALVREFHTTYGLPDAVAQHLEPNLDFSRLAMRMALIAEETAELFGAVYGGEAYETVQNALASVEDRGARDVVETADALADLVYVVYGMALEAGIDLDAVLAEVHSSNLSKLMPDGSVRRRADGKVLKGPNFREPDIARALRSRARLNASQQSAEHENAAHDDPWNVRSNSVEEARPVQNGGQRTNPLMEPSTLDFEVPDFANIRVDDLEEAIFAGLQEEKEDWDRIALNPEPAGVENTVAAVDRAGETLARATRVFHTLSSSVGGPELDALQEKLAPVFASHEDDFYTNSSLFERYVEVSKREDLEPETRWLVDQTIADFERSGVNLDGASKARMRQLNAKIAELEAQIDTRISKQLTGTAATGRDVAELEGLTPSEIEAATTPQGWRLGVRNFSLPPQLSSLSNPKTRAKLLESSLTRGRDDETDTRSLIIELANARKERANLLGFASHAEIVTAEETVPSPKEARRLLEEVGSSARAALEEEAARYRKEADDLGPADWPYVEDRARRAALGVDSSELRQYLELNNVVENGVFYAANRLYGLQFKPRPDIVGWTPETKSWEVLEEDGGRVGLFMADYYARPGKSGGAWMNDLVPGSRRSGKLPVILNNANFTKPESGPTLLSWDDVETVFHEFGHALHGLLTDTYYDATAGTEVPRDFVELPSQLNEVWAYHPEVLAQYARHWQTGEALPATTREALARSKFFGQPHATIEYVQSALIDQAWHDGTAPLPTSPEQIEQFEADALAAASVDHELVVPRYRTPYFAHAFAGGYDAGYYSYMWSEAMVGELEEWLAESDNGGLNRVSGEKLRRELLSRGDSRDPLESFVAVRGHMPSGAAVARRRGFAESAA